MKAADIADGHVVELAAAWQRDGGAGVVARLISEGVPPKLALYKVERLVERGRLDFGVSPRFAWPSGPMCWRRSGRGDWCAEHQETWRHEGEHLPADYPPRPTSHVTQHLTNHLDRTAPMPTEPSSTAPRLRSVPQLVADGMDAEEALRKIDDWLAANGMRDARWYRADSIVVEPGGHIHATQIDSDEIEPNGWPSPRVIWPDSDAGEPEEAVLQFTYPLLVPIPTELLMLDSDRPTSAI